MEHIKHNSPFITVIITAYGRKEYLLDAFKSAMNQTLGRNEYEIIVTKNFKDKEIDSYVESHDGRLVFFKRGNLGLQLVDALKYAKGEVICLLEDDDLFTNDKLEYINRCFVNNRKLIYVHNYPIFIDNNGNKFKRGLNKYEVGYELLLKPEDRNLVKLIKAEVLYPAQFPSCTCIKKDVILKFSKQLKKAGTHDFFIYLISLFTLGDIFLTYKRLTLYRLHESDSNSLDNYNLSIKKRNRKMREVIKICNILIKTNSKNNINISKKYFLFCYRRFKIDYYFSMRYKNYRIKVLINYIKNFEPFFLSLPKIALLQGLQVILYLISPKTFRRLNNKRINAYIKSKS